MMLGLASRFALALTLVPWSLSLATPKRDLHHGAIHAGQVARSLDYIPMYDGKLEKRSKVVARATTAGAFELASSSFTVPSWFEFGYYHPTTGAFVSEESSVVSFLKTSGFIVIPLTNATDLFPTSASTRDAVDTSSKGVYGYYTSSGTFISDTASVTSLLNSAGYFSDHSLPSSDLTWVPTTPLPSYYAFGYYAMVWAYWITDEVHTFEYLRARGYKAVTMDSQSSAKLYPSSFTYPPRNAELSLMGQWGYFDSGNTFHSMRNSSTAVEGIINAAGWYKP